MRVCVFTYLWSAGCFVLEMELRSASVSVDRSGELLTTVFCTMFSRAVLRCLFKLSSYEVLVIFSCRLVQVLPVPSPVVGTASAIASASASASDGVLL